jgi:predicted RNA-binding protein with PIN domain
MPYIVDGHNLIPRVGLQLKAEDDEIALVEMLREFCRVRKKRVEVYFDGAPPGENRTRKFGYVTAHFVRQGRTADDAIRTRLRKMGKSAKNWTVVSSDREVLNSARAVQAKRISADDFAQEVMDAKFAAFENPSEERNLSSQEVKQWLDLFSSSEKED